MPAFVFGEGRACDSPPCYYSLPEHGPLSPRRPLPMTTFHLKLSFRLQTADPQAAGGCFGDLTGHGPTHRSDSQPGFGCITSHPLSAAGGDSKPGAALGGPGWMGLGLALGPEGDALKLECDAGFTDL